MLDQGSREELERSLRTAAEAVGATLDLLLPVEVALGDDFPRSGLVALAGDHLLLAWKGLVEEGRQAWPLDELQEARLERGLVGSRLRLLSPDGPLLLEEREGDAAFQRLLEALGVDGQASDGEGGPDEVEEPAPRSESGDARGSFSSGFEEAGGEAQAPPLAASFDGLEGEGVEPAAAGEEEGPWEEGTALEPGSALARDGAPSGPRPGASSRGALGEAPGTECAPSPGEAPRTEYAPSPGSRGPPPGPEGRASRRGRGLLLAGLGAVVGLFLFGGLSYYFHELPPSLSRLVPGEDASEGPGLSVRLWGPLSVPLGTPEQDVRNRDLWEIWTLGPGTSPDYEVFPPLSWPVLGESRQRAERWLYLRVEIQHQPALCALGFEGRGLVHVSCRFPPQLTQVRHRQLQRGLLAAWTRAFGEPSFRRLALVSPGSRDTRASYWEWRWGAERWSIFSTYLLDENPGHAGWAQGPRGSASRGSESVLILSHLYGTTD